MRRETTLLLEIQDNFTLLSVYLLGNEKKKAKPGSDSFDLQFPQGIFHVLEERPNGSNNN